MALKPAKLDKPPNIDKHTITLIWLTYTVFIN